MADVNKTVQITYQASTKGLEQSLKKIPQITDKNGKKAASTIDENFKKMERSASSSSKKINTQVKSMDSSFKGLSKSMKGMGGQLALVGAAVGGAVLGFVALQQKIADLTNELVDASTKTGIAVETLAGLRLAAEGSGLAFSSLEGGLIKFQQSMDQAGQGSKNLADKFQTLGVNVKNSNGELRESDAVFNEVINALGEMGNETERNATAMQLFGRQAGPALIQSGALDNLQQMTLFTKEFGVALDEEGIAKMGDFQRAMAEFDTVAVGVFNNLIDAVLGEMGAASAVRRMAGAFIYVGSVAGTVIEGISATFRSLFGTAQGLVMLLEGNTAQALALFNSINDDITTAGANVMNIFAIANQKVDTFNRLSSKNELPKKLKTVGEQAKSSTKDVEELTEAVEDLDEEIDELVEEELEFNIKAWKQLSQIGKDLDEKLNDPIDDATKNFQKNNKALSSLLEDTNLLLQEIFDVPRGERTEDQIQSIIRLLEIQEQTEKEMFKNQMAYEKELAETRKQLRNQALMESGEMAMETFGQVTELITQLNDREIEKIGERFEKEQERIDKMVKDGIITAEEAAFRRSGIEKRYEEEVQELRLKSFKANQASAVADVIFQGAIAATRAFADYGATPAGIAAAAFVAASTGAQLATIASQSPPKFDVGGMIGSSDPNMPDQVSANLLTGEAVLDRTTVRGLGGEEGVRQLQNGNGMDNIVIIQPFKHIDRYNRSMSRRSSNRIGSRGY